MKQKNHYLIWREKNDFFTALSVTGRLWTWSLATCNLLYSQPVDNIDVNDFEIFQANPMDDYYCKNYHRGKRSTIQLLKHKKYRKIIN